MTIALCVIFFISGAAALILETLWFRLVGLQVGNTVWASSIVLAAFMCGLGLGNALAARYGRRIRRPLLTYAATEIVVGIVGLAIVVGLPHMGDVIVPAARYVSKIPGGVNLLRWSVAFIGLLVPSTAMGLTLPLLTKTLGGVDPRFGSLLGKLYGWNTLGGVVGVLGTEMLLIPRLGILGTAAVAAASYVGAGIVAFTLSSRQRPLATVAPDHGGGDGRVPSTGWRVLLGTFLAGGAVMALEVVWFRFLQLFVYGSALAFSGMLAVILMGIALGGLAASQWIRRKGLRTSMPAAVALLAGLATEVSYLTFTPAVAGVTYSVNSLGHCLLLSLRLMFPTAFLSGVLFTFFGHELRRGRREDAETTGLLTLFNTMGATVGALAGGLVLLPVLGVERALFALVLAYVAAAVTTLPSTTIRIERWGLVVLGATCAVFVALFPFGLMSRSFLKASLQQFHAGQVVAVREGLTESIVLLERQWGFRPVSYQLITNGHSMSSTSFYARRYMKLFVYWAAAVQPGARRALLISYGTGTTAVALQHSRQLEAVDVVDISRDVLDLSDLVYPEGQRPLDDPRFTVHIEDGRFYLHVTQKEFDLITAEPPPPRGAGVVNLYTREFFQLARQRLSARGVITYWLPIHALAPDDTAAIMRGFCDVFEDCSLWRGIGPDWMLAGSRNGLQRLDEAELAALWDDPVVGSDLVSIGIEMPEQLGALFIADRADILAFARDALPLEDDFPGRLTCRIPSREDRRLYSSWASVDETKRRFAESAYIDSLWPPALRERSLRYFVFEGLMDALHDRLQPRPTLRDLAEVLESSSLRTLPLLMTGSEPRIQQIAQEAPSSASASGLSLELGFGALARRDYEDAVRRFEDARRLDPRDGDVGLWLAFAFLMDDRAREALDALELVGSPAVGEREPDYRWLRARAMSALRRAE